MSPEQKRRIAQAYIAYSMQSEAERRYFDEWLNTMPKPFQATFRSRGYEMCRDEWEFRRFVAEQNDEEIGEYMQRHLSADDYRVWQKQGRNVRKGRKGR